MNRFLIILALLVPACLSKSQPADDANNASRSTSTSACESFVLEDGFVLLSVPSGIEWTDVTPELESEAEEAVRLTTKARHIISVINDVAIVGAGLQPTTGVQLTAASGQSGFPTGVHSVVATGDNIKRDSHSYEDVPPGTYVWKFSDIPNVDRAMGESPMRVLPAWNPRTLDDKTCVLAMRNVVR